MISGIVCNTYTVTGFVDQPTVLLGGNIFNGIGYVNKYYLPNNTAGARQRGITITDGLEVPYPETIDLDSSWTNFPADTAYFSYTKSGGTGWNRDTVNIQGGTASLRTVASEYVDVNLLAKGTFDSDSILKVSFWAKAAAASSGYVSLFTTLSGSALAITATITGTSWVRYTILCPIADLTNEFLRIGGTTGTVNVQYINISTISFR
jgi:hypothetical protein